MKDLNDKLGGQIIMKKSLLKKFFALLKEFFSLLKKSSETISIVFIAFIVCLTIWYRSGEIIKIVKDPTIKIESIGFGGMSFVPIKDDKQKEEKDLSFLKDEIALLPTIPPIKGEKTNLLKSEIYKVKFKK